MVKCRATTAQKMKFPIKDFFNKCDSHLLKKSLMENFIFFAKRIQDQIKHQRWSFFFENIYWLLTIFEKHFIMGVCQNPKYAPQLDKYLSYSLMKIR